MSHFIPKAMFKYIRDPSAANPNPLVVTSKGAKVVVKQIVAPLLCADCERRFSKFGEHYTMQQVWNSKGRFPLLERLNVAVEVATVEGTSYYSGAACGIGTDKLAYFALSVLWRASVNQWNINGENYQLSLGSYQEPIRQYLLGQMAFPPDVSVMLTVSSDMYSRMFYKPTPATFPIPVTAFAMLALGIHFLIITDRFSPAQICCVRSPEKRVYKRDCKQKALEAYGKLIGVTS